MDAQIKAQCCVNLMLEAILQTEAGKAALTVCHCCLSMRTKQLWRLLLLSVPVSPAAASERLLLPKVVCDTCLLHRCSCLCVWPLLKLAAAVAGVLPCAERRIQIKQSGRS
jgi:hypothetical protein